MLQARMTKDDSRLYNPSRDVAHNFGDVMREVTARFRDRRWPELDQLLTDLKIEDAQLAQAVEAAVLFSVAELKKGEDMETLLKRLGWWDLPPAAQVAVCAMIGTVMLGMFYAGVRESTLGGSGPLLTMQDLREAGQKACHAITRPRWERKLRDWIANAKAAWRALWTPERKNDAPATPDRIG